MDSAAFSRVAICKREAAVVPQAVDPDGASAFSVPSPVRTSTLSTSSARRSGVSMWSRPSLVEAC